MKSKRTAAIGSCILAAAMILAGCSSKPAQTAAEASKTEKAAGSTQQNSTVQENKETEAPKQETAELDYPKKPINLIVAFNAGGDTDLNNRLMAKYVEKELGVSVVVTNLGGSNGAVALTQYKDSKETDGYTILGSNISGLTNNEATGVMEFGWDAFETVAVFGQPAGELVFASKNSGITSIEDLIGKSAESPNKIRFAVATGGGSHVTALAINKAGAACAIVDGGDGANRLASLIGGHVEVASIPYLNAKEYIETGDVVPLLSVGTARSSALPEVPTAIESGIDLAHVSGYAWVAPKGTDQAICEKLNKAMMKIAKENEDYQKEQYEYNYNDALVRGIDDSKSYLAGARESAFKNAEVLKSEAQK